MRGGRAGSLLRRNPRPAQVCRPGPRAGARARVHAGRAVPLGAAPGRPLPPGELRPLLGRAHDGLPWCGCRQDRITYGSRRHAPVYLAAGTGGGRKLLLSSDMLVEGFVNLVLQTKGPTHLLGVEFAGSQVLHHFFVSFALPDIPPPLLTDVADVEFGVAIIE